VRFRSAAVEVRVLYCDAEGVPVEDEEFTNPEEEAPEILNEDISTDADVPMDDAGDAGRIISTAFPTEGSGGRCFSLFGDAVGRTMLASELYDGSRAGDRGESGGGVCVGGIDKG